MMAVSQNAVELENDMSKDAANNYQKGATGGGYVVNTGYKASDGTPFDLTFFCDKTSVEVQFPNGQIYTVARYAVDNNQDVTIYAQDPNGDNFVSFEKQSLQLVSSKPNSVKNHISDNNPIIGSQSLPVSNNTENISSSESNAVTSNSILLNNKKLISGETTNTTERLKRHQNSSIVSSLTIKENSIKTNSTQVQNHEKSIKTVTVKENEEAASVVETNIKGKTTTTVVNSKSHSSTDALPQAGETSNKGLIIAGIMTVLSSLGFGASELRRRR